MKKSNLLMAIVAAAGMASCTSTPAPQASLKSDIDSLSYLLGMSNAQGLDMYLTQQLGLDSANIVDFMKGLNDGFKENSKKDIAYSAGKQIGQNVSANGVKMMSERIFGANAKTSLNKTDFLAGFVAGAKGQKTLGNEVPGAYIDSKVKEIQARTAETEYAENKAAGVKFLAENAKKEGVKVTESGLQYKVIKAGKGAIPEKTSTVKVHYTGTLIDGTKFDSSKDHGTEPATFRADQLIKGWTEALTMMPVGSKWEIYVPQELAYGSANQGTIKPFSALIFELELVGIDKE